MSQQEIPARVIAHGVTQNKTIEPIPAPALDDLAKRLLTANEFLWPTGDVGWIEVWRTPSLTYAFFSDVDGFVQGQYSHDGGQVDEGAVLRTYVAGTWISISTGSHRLPYWRPQFQCGPVAQSEFHLLAFPQTSPPAGPVFRLDQEVTDHSVAQTVRTQSDARDPLDPNGKRKAVEWVDGGFAVANRSTGKTLKRLVANRTAGTTDLITAVIGKRIKVYALWMQGAGVSSTVQLRDGAAGAMLTLPWDLSDPRDPQIVVPPAFLFATSAGNALRVIVTGTMNIEVSYWDDDGS